MFFTMNKGAIGLLLTTCIYTKNTIWAPNTGGICRGYNTLVFDNQFSVNQASWFYDSSLVFKFKLSNNLN